MTRKSKRNDGQRRKPNEPTQEPARAASPSPSEPKARRRRSRAKSEGQAQGQAQPERAPRRAKRHENVGGEAHVPTAAEAAPQPAAEQTFSFDSEYADMDVQSEEAPELGLGSRMIPPTPMFDEDETPPSVTTPSAEAGDLAAQIRSLEARLDGLIRRSAELRSGDDTPVQRESPSRTAQPIEVAKVTASELAPQTPTEFSDNSYYARQWGRVGLRSRAEEIDDFGLDPDFEQKFSPISHFLYRRYFRTQVEGIHNIPGEGRCVIVANHSGTLPLDGLMLRMAVRQEHPSARDLRWLAEDFIFYLPFAGVFMNRVGAVRACQENAERLLSKENLVAVFPEGIHGIKKLFRERYRLQRFGRGGYIRLCLRMQAPLVPCAVIGAEESSPLLYRIERITELFGLPYLPITPTFPWLGPLGLVPAPSKWKIRFGEPIYLDTYGPEAADDHVLVGRLSDRVRNSIQAMLDSGVRERKSIWFG